MIVEPSNVQKPKQVLNMAGEKHQVWEKESPTRKADYSASKPATTTAKLSAVIEEERKFFYNKNRL